MKRGLFIGRACDDETWIGFESDTPFVGVLTIGHGDKWMTYRMLWEDWVMVVEHAAGQHDDIVDEST